MKKEMNQSKLVFLTNAISVLLLVLVCALFFWNMQMNGAIAQANDDRMALYENANRFMNGSAYLTNEVRAYAATGDQTHRDNYFNEVNTLKNRDIGVQNMQDIGITKEEQTIIDEMSGLSNNLVPLEENAMEDAAGGSLEKALAYVYGSEYEQSISKINQTKTKFVSMLNERTTERIEELTARQNVLQGVNIAALIAVILFQIINFLLILKKVINPIVAVQKEMGQIASGNLSSTFELEADTSEIGMLVDSIHRTKVELKRYIQDISEKLGEMSDGNFAMAMDLDYVGDFKPIQQAIENILDSLNKAMRQVDETAEQVTSGAGQAMLRVVSSSDAVSDLIQEIANASGEQAEALSQVASGVDQVSSVVQTNSATAEQSAAAAQELSSQAQIMKDLVLQFRLRNVNGYSIQ